MADSQVYARQLLPKKHGYPMYYPEPLDNLPLEYRKRGVGIGDVGIIQPDGSFEFAFNIFVPWAEGDREINCFGVPDGFVPMQFDRQLIASKQNKHAKGSVIMSNCEKSKTASGNIGVGDGYVSSTTSGTIGFNVTSSSSETAVLTVPDGALGEDYYNKKAIRKFSITHALSWYEFINVKLGREAPNGSLYVVTGCDRATAWGIATVEKHSSSESLSLQFTAVKGLLGASYSCSWSTTPGAVWRTSTAVEDFALGADIKQPQNQCLFVRGYKIMVREGLMALQSPNELVAVELITDHSKSDSLLRRKDRSFPGTASEGRSLLGRVVGYQGGGKSSRESDDGWSAEKELDPHVGAYHPLDTINRYLLDHTQAQIAITHESDWWALSPDETVPNESEIISRLVTHYALSIESEGAFLTPNVNEHINAQSGYGSAMIVDETTEYGAEDVTASTATGKMDCSDDPPPQHGPTYTHTPDPYWPAPTLMIYSAISSGQDQSNMPIKMRKKESKACDRCRKQHRGCKEVIEDLGCKRCREKGLQCIFSRPSERTTPDSIPDVTVGPKTPSEPQGEGAGQFNSMDIPAASSPLALDEDPLGLCLCVQGIYVCRYHSEQEGV